MRTAVLTALVIGGSLMLISPRPAWADRCPYCGQEYGEAAPGDEARVYALRAEHEASCSSRPSGTGGSSGGGNRWTRQDQIEFEEAQAVERERQRLIAEEKRKKKIKEEAEERAENETRRLQWEENKKKVTAMLKGSAPSISDGGLKSPGGSNVFLTPRGVKTSPEELIGEEKVEAVRTRIAESGTTSEASKRDAENMRRSIWLYRKAAQAPSVQEAEFLISQADEAAQGHDLKVEVPAGREVSEITPEKIARFKEIKKEIETQRIQAEMLSGKKLGLEDKRDLQRRSAEELEARLRELRARRAAGQQEAAKPETAQAPEKPGETIAEKAPPEAGKISEKEKGPEEDLLAQLLEVRKQMEDADKALSDLASEGAEIKKNISEQEKKLGAVLN